MLRHHDYIRTSIAFTHDFSHYSILPEDCIKCTSCSLWISFGRSRANVYVVPHVYDNTTYIALSLFWELH